MVFTLPQIFLTCFVYQVQSGEVFNGWNIQQPTVLDLRNTYNATISRNNFTKSATAGFCGDVVLWSGR